jgi:hypothetical protein
MKFIKIPGLLFIAGILLAACARPAYVEKDETVNFSKYRTYSWVDTKADKSDSSSVNLTDLSERQVRDAVNSELAKAGWKEVSDRPDLLITYDVMVERASEENSNPVYSQPYTRWYYNPYSRRWHSIYYPSQLVGYEVEEREVKEGTITIMIIDAKTDQTIWQGWTTDKVNSRNLTSREIQNSVKNIFRKFDIAQQ